MCVCERQDVDVLFMQSDGGLTPMDQFCGSRAVLSGPAGGVVGYALTAYTNTHHTPVIGFDMGGETQRDRWSVRKEGKWLDKKMLINFSRLQEASLLYYQELFHFTTCSSLLSFPQGFHVVILSLEFTKFIDSFLSIKKVKS